MHRKGITVSEDRSNRAETVVRVKRKLDDDPVPSILLQAMSDLPKISSLSSQLGALSTSRTAQAAPLPQEPVVTTRKFRLATTSTSADLTDRPDSIEERLLAARRQRAIALRKYTVGFEAQIASDLAEARQQHKAQAQSARLQLVRARRQSSVPGDSDPMCSRYNVVDLETETVKRVRGEGAASAATSETEIVYDIYVMEEPGTGSVDDGEEGCVTYVLSCTVVSMLGEWGFRCFIDAGVTLSDRAFG